MCSSDLFPSHDTGWWVIHLWVEATWEVFVASVIGWALIKIIGANRQIVEMWLWIEVAMLIFLVAQCSTSLLLA